MRRLRRARIAQQKVEIFKPIIDRRYSDTEVVSHDSNAIRCTPVESSGNILLLSSDTDVVGIDEAQFFDNGLVDVCTTLASYGVRVIVAGLDMDYTGKPFGPVPYLMACAEYVSKVHAICVNCGDLANFSYRRSGVPDLWNLVQVIPTRQYAGLVMISCELTNPNKNVSQMYLFSDIASMLNARAEISTDAQVRRPVFDTVLL